MAATEGIPLGELADASVALTCTNCEDTMELSPVEARTLAAKLTAQACRAEARMLAEMRHRLDQGAKP